MPATRPARSLTRAVRAAALAAAVVLSLTTAAAADPVVISSVTGSNFYRSCGSDASLTAALQPDVAPPSVPDMLCGVYAANSGTLTARMAAHASGAFTASAYVRTPLRAGGVKLLKNGVQVGASISVPVSSEGWYSVAAQDATWLDALDIIVTASSSGTGQVKVGMVHGDVSPTALGQPGNWATTPIPANVATEPGLAPSGLPLAQEFARELGGQAAASTYANTTSFTPKFWHVPLSTPREPVRLCRATGNCVPSYADALWRAAMGVDNATTMDRATGKPVGGTYLGGGIPLTADVTGAPGTDSEAVVYVDGWRAKNADGTDFVRPDGQFMEGQSWELWHLRDDPTYDPAQPISPANTRKMFSWGSRRTGFLRRGDNVDATYTLDTLSGRYNRAATITTDGPTLRRWYGPNVQTPGEPNSTAWSNYWGVTAAKLPFIVDVVSDADCQAVANGAQDFGHAVGIETRYNRWTGTSWWWPGNGSDGQAAAATLALVEGMRAYLPADEPVPAGLSAAGLAEFRTLQRYGLAIDDTVGGGSSLVTNADGSYRSGGAIVQRFELDSPNCGAIGAGSTMLRQMPWGHVVLVKRGSDAVPNPTG
jgi:hypothetical protein